MRQSVGGRYDFFDMSIERLSTKIRQRYRTDLGYAESAVSEDRTETLPAVSVLFLTRINFGYASGTQSAARASSGAAFTAARGSLAGSSSSADSRPVGPGRRRSENDVILPDFNQFECFWKFRKAEKALVQMDRRYHSFVPKSKSRAFLFG